MESSITLRKILNYFNLHPDLDDFEKIHESILKDVTFKGTNLWILMFAIVVASVGLNMNSTAVIIGAMLISPLMGPIIGMGYSVATYNFELLQKAVKNFTFAVFTSLLASTTYFALSPISTAHSELLARTSPTIYDVLIALFGGLAGIIAISSRQKGNVIPGVAIATALMPPLCTAGYGLATGQFNFFFGAFYLFTINTVFIALAALIVSQVLKFPIRTIIDDSQRVKVNRYITFVIVIVLFPSIYFGYNLVQKEKFLDNANGFVKNISVFEGNYLLRSDINPDKRIIYLVYGGVTMSEAQKYRIREKLLDFNLTNVEIDITEGLTFDAYDTKLTEVDDLRGELANVTTMLRDAQYQLDSISDKNYIGQRILDEIKSLYPQITRCSFAETNTFTAEGKRVPNVGIVILELKPDHELNEEEQERVKNWLQKRLKNQNIKVFYE